jgi:predicted lipoprotein with Yx(FWY)xxD motif
MNKNAKIGVGILVVVIIAAVGFMAFHNSNNTPASTGSSGNNSSTQGNAPAVNNAVLTTKTDATLGQYLADPSGKPLYTYNADSSGKSNCTGTCLSDWPVYQDKGSTSNLPAGVGTIKRADNGQTQYTYNGMPLYYFTGDSNGQATGNGVEDFSIAKPAAASSSSSRSSSSSPNMPAPSTNTNTSPSSSSSSYPY